MAGDGIILIDLSLADFWLGRLHIDYRPLNLLVCSLYLAAVFSLPTWLYCVFKKDYLQ